MTTQVDMATTNDAQPSPLLSASSLAVEVSDLRALQAKGDHKDAVAGANRLLVTHSENRDLLLIAAHSLRCLLYTSPSPRDS